MARSALRNPLRPFYLVKVTGKGTAKFIYIPKDIQDVLGIEIGDYAEIRVDEGDRKIVVKFLKPGEVE